MLRSGLASLIVDVNLRRTLRPCAPFSYPAHLSRSSRCIITSRCSYHTALRFRIQRCSHRLSCFSHSSSSSSSEKNGGSTSSTRSSLVSGMGQDDAVTANRNSFSGHGQLDGGENSSPPQSSSKVLTLPTVLTLGRVAAVPLLVASTLICSQQLFWIRELNFWVCRIISRARFFFVFLLENNIRHRLDFSLVHGDNLDSQLICFINRLDCFTSKSRESFSFLGIVCHLKLFILLFFLL